MKFENSKNSKKIQSLSLSNDNFPIEIFLIDGFSNLFQFDRDVNGGGIMLYVRELYKVLMFKN